MQKIFTGRIGRLDFLVGFLVYGLIMALAFVLLGLFLGSHSNFKLISFVILIPPFILLFSAMIVRRTHDLGYSWWVSLLTCVPILGYLYLLCMILMKGEQRENRFGSIPKVEWTIEYFVKVVLP